MRTLILVLLLTPFLSFAQSQNIYVKLTDAGGKQINGDVVMKGYEKNMQALSFSQGGKNNTQLSFTMNISGASADLKKAMASGAFLLNGQITIIKPGGNIPVITSSIKMEKIRVLACAESMGCNNMMTTSVTLQVTRIGWTYYQTDARGVNTISNKYGYDAETGQAWNNF